MMILLSLLVCIAGALLYSLASNAKLQEMGRIAFFVGLLAFLFSNAGSMVNLLHK